MARPNRETEGMKDGSDAVSDYPLLNALLNTASGATWVSLHHGGGVGIGIGLTLLPVLYRASGFGGTNHSPGRLASCVRSTS